MRRFKTIFLLSVAASFLGVSSDAWAAASFNTISFKPTTDQGYYLTVEGSDTLGQWGYAAGLLAEFSNDSLITRTVTGAKIQDVINEQLVLNASGAVGLLDWLNAGLLIPFVPLQKFSPFGTGTTDNGARMGDIRFNLKARILDPKTHPLGIAVVPFATFPTGNDSHFVGEGKVTGGGTLVLETPRYRDRVSAALNVGADGRQSVTLSPGTTLNSHFLYGAAVNVEVVHPLQFIAEINGWTPFNNFFKDNNRNLEVNGAFRYLLTNGLALTAGGGTGLLDGAGAPDFRVFASVAYRHPREEAAPPKEEVIRTNKIHFEFDKARILPQSFPVLNEIIATIKSRPEVEHVTIEGHTDSKGTDEYNLRLSDRRAAAVRLYMIEHGVPASKLSSVGKGEREPIAPNEINGRDNPEGRALNRRVEFHMEIAPGARLKMIQGGPAPTFPEQGGQGEEVRSRRSR